MLRYTNMQATLANYPDERSRRKILNPILSHVLDFHLQVIENDDETKADGTLEGFVQQSVLLFLLKEDKNELGDSGLDTSIQAGLSTARSWVQSVRRLKTSRTKLRLNFLRH